MPYIKNEKIRVQDATQNWSNNKLMDNYHHAFIYIIKYRHQKFILSVSSSSPLAANIKVHESNRKFN